MIAAMSGPNAALREPILIPAGYSGGRMPPTDNRIAAGVLAVRAARVALARDSADPGAAMSLAEACQRFLSAPSLFELQYATALVQTQTRVENATARGVEPIGPAFAAAR